MAEAKRPNYYRLLELDPSVDDWTQIEERIDELKHKYDRIPSDAPASLERKAASFKILTSDRSSTNCIWNVMQSDALRKKEAGERRRELSLEQERLDSMLSVLVNRGAHSDRDIRDIAKELTGFDEDAVRKRLGELDSRNTDAKTETKSHKKPEPNVTPAAEVLSIEDDLSGLFCETLYEFLGPNLGPHSSQRSLEQRYEAWKKKLSGIGKGKPEHKVPNAILGHVRKHLLSADDRTKYNTYLTLRRLRGLDIYIQLWGRESKSITEANINQIVSDSKLKGVSASEIRDYVKDWVSTKKGWSLVESAASAETLNRLMCGYCGRIAKDHRQTNCHECGKPLTIRCPQRRCRKVIPTQDPCCSYCGFQTGDAPFVEELLTQAEAERRRGNVRAAKDFALQAQSLWRQFDGVETELKAIEKLEKKLKADEDRARREREKQEADDRRRREEARREKEAREAEKQKLELEIRAERERVESKRQLAKLEDQKAQQEHLRAMREHAARVREEIEREERQRKAEEQRRKEAEEEAQRRLKELRRLEQRIIAARLFIDEGRLEEARDRIDRLRQDYPDSDKVSVLFVAWEEEQKRQRLIQQEVERQQKVLEDVRSLCRRDRYFEAEARLAGSVSDDADRLRQRIHEHVHLARRQADDARRCHDAGDLDAARTHCEKSLRHCSDYPDALVLLELIRFESSSTGRTPVVSCAKVAEVQGWTLHSDETTTRRLIAVAACAVCLIGSLIVGRLWLWPSFDHQLRSIHKEALNGRLADATNDLHQLIADDVQAADGARRYFVGVGQEFVRRSGVVTEVPPRDKASAVINLNQARIMFRLAAELDERDAPGLIADSWFLQARMLERASEHSEAAEDYGRAADAFMAAAEHYKSVGYSDLATDSLRNSATCISNKARLSRDSP